MITTCIPSAIAGMFLLFSPVLLQGQPILPEDDSPWADEAVRALSNYVQIPSISGSEAVAGQYLAGLCREKGLHLFFMGEEDGAFNFAASLYPLSPNKPNVIFLNHIDVVEADTAVSKWTYPPFSGVVAEDRIWGRGSFDNKGLGIMQLYAIASHIERARLEELPFNITLLAVSCEETQCDGGLRMVIDEHLETLNPVVVFGEGPPSIDGVVPSHPEQLIYAIAMAHKRALWLELSVAIPSIGHGSVTPHQYANKELVHALDRLSRWRQEVQYNSCNVQILKDLGRLEGGVAGFFLKHPRLWKPLVAPALRKEPALAVLFMDNCTVTFIEAGGGAVNVIPQHARALVDCRLLPGTDSGQFLGELKKQLGSEHIKVDVILDMPSVEVSTPENPFYQMLYETIRDHHPEAAVMPIMLPNFTDDGWFRAKGVPCYSSMPVFMSREQMERVHGSDENLSVPSLIDGIRIYSDLIHRIESSVGEEE